MKVKNKNMPPINYQNAKEYQNVLFDKLKKQFGEFCVESEWNIYKKSTDSLRRDKKRYSPRLDLAVGPFNNIGEHTIDYQPFAVFLQRHNKQLINELSPNPKPRSGLAIEVVFSGSSKHILGDLTNASIMGLCGFVVVKNEKNILKKVNRIYEYIKEVRTIGKISPDMFRNIKIYTTDDFLSLFQKQS